MEASKEITAVGQWTEGRTSALLQRIDDLIVNSPDSLLLANDFLKALKQFYLALNEEFDEGIKQAHKHHKYLVAQKKKWETPAKEKEFGLLAKMHDYTEQQDRIREQKQREAEIERQNLKRRSEEAADKAYDAITNGDLRAAEKIQEDISKEINAPPKVIVPEKEEMPDTHVKRTYTAVVTNIDLLPDMYLMPKQANQKLLDLQARTLKEQFQIPGAKVVVKKSFVTRLKP